MHGFSWRRVTTQSTEDASHTRQTKNKAQWPMSCIGIRSSRHCAARHDENCIPARRLRLIVVTPLLTSPAILYSSRQPARCAIAQSADRSPHSSASNPCQLLLLPVAGIVFEWGAHFSSSPIDNPPVLSLSIYIHPRWMLLLQHRQTGVLICNDVGNHWSLSVFLFKAPASRTPKAGLFRLLVMLQLTKLDSPDVCVCVHCKHRVYEERSHASIMKHFTARRSYASAVLGVVILSVRPSVCLWYACFVTQPNNALRIFWYHTKGQSL